MDEDDVRFRLDYTVTFRSLAAGLIAVRVLVLDVGRHVDLRGQISAEYYADAEALYQEMFTDDESPLCHTEAWLLLEAMQKTEVPGQPEATASFGIRTGWGDPLLD